MKPRNLIKSVAVGVLFLLPLIVPRSSYGEEISHSLGYRLWNADWRSVSEVGLSRSQIHMIYYNLSYSEWSGLLLIGYGDGWSGAERGGASRTDVQLAIARSHTFDIASVQIGAGWHYMDYKFNDFPGFGGKSLNFGTGEATVHGPEVSLSAHKTVGDTGIGLHVTGTVMPYLWWDYDEDALDVDDNHGTTMGYSMDVGVSYTWRRVSLSAGWRHSSLERDEGQVVAAESAVDEQIKGAYVQIGTSF